MVASTFSRNKQHGANRSADDAPNTGRRSPSNIWTLQKTVWELLGTLVLLFVKSSQLPPAAGSLPVGQTGQACLTLSVHQHQDYLHSLFTNSCTFSHQPIKLKFPDDATLIGLISGADESICRRETDSRVTWSSRDTWICRLTVCSFNCFNSSGFPQSLGVCSWEYLTIQKNVCSQTLMLDEMPVKQRVQGGVPGQGWLSQLTAVI